MHYVSTEVAVPGSALADVLASDGKILIEYEVKISMADLKGDSKKYKHFLYDPTPIVWTLNTGTKLGRTFEIKHDDKRYSWSKKEEFTVFEGDQRFTYKNFSTIEEAKTFVEQQIGARKGCPNMLYYVIPRDMWEGKKEQIESILPEQYGIITFTDYNYHGLTVVRKAKKLHTNTVSLERLRIIAARMSSEIAALSSAHYHSHKHMSEYGKMVEYRINLKEIAEDE